MKIAWLVDGIQKNDDGELFSSLATHRYRVILPAEALGDLGHEVEVFNLADLKRGRRPDPVDVLVVSKLLPNKSFPLSEQVQVAEAEILRQQVMGATVIADINDHHFDNPKIGDWWMRLLSQVDVIVCGSEPMAEIVRGRVVKPVMVVADPVAFPRGSVSVRHGQARGVLGRLAQGMFKRHGASDRLRLVWYGNVTNWPSMQNLLPCLAKFSEECNISLTIVSRPGAGIESRVAEVCSRYGEGFTAEFMPWSEEETWRAVNASDVVLLPSEPGQLVNSVKTANRFVDGLYAGRFVVAAPLPSYAAFAPFGWIGDDLMEGLRWYLKNPGEAAERIVKGQSYVEAHHAPDAIGNAWLAVMKSFAGLRRVVDNPRSVGSAAEVLRLNLGCGDKVLDGYVNVDIAPSRRGKVPDVLCDITKLDAFESNSADEILAVHVVEHFWRWEVLGVLREWIRVLKPGGEMVLECPNLLSACEAFLRDPSVAKGAGSQGQQTMWVFYGDPAWKDPLMIHRWGYTPESLSDLMSEAGLVNVRQEPALYKMREPRDMRIVGVKPL